MMVRNFTDIKEILFKNKSLKQTIFKNTFWITTAQVTTKFLKLFLLIYVARILGATDYGKFSFAFAVTGLFIIFIDLGISKIATRELAREKKKERDFPFLLTLEIFLSLAVLVLIILISFFITSSPEIRRLIWILAIYNITHGLGGIVYAFFRARQQMEYEAFGIIFEAILITSLGFFVIFSSPSVLSLSYAYLLAGIIFIVSLLFLFHFKFVPLKISISKTVWQNYLAMSWPLAMVGVLGVVYGQIDSVMMGYWNQITETGWYNAAYRIIGAVLVLNSFVSTSFFPVLSKYFKESKRIFQKVWTAQIELLILLALPIVSGGIIFAPRIIEFIYGSGYQPSILVFQILLLMVGINFLQMPFRQALIAADHQRKVFWTTLIGTGVNVILNAILIPRFSLYGAAIATSTTWFILLLCFIVFTYRFTSIRPLGLKLFSTSALAAIAVSLMYFVVRYSSVYNFHILLSILTGAAIYFSTFFGLKYFGKKLRILLR